MLLRTGRGRHERGAVSGTSDFDDQAAWLRQFERNARDELGAFALRLREALPDRVTLQRSRGGLFGGAARVTGVTVELGQNRYGLELAQGRLQASIALVVYGIALSTRSVEPGDWFVRLGGEMQAAGIEAAALSRSLGDFMAH